MSSSCKLSKNHAIYAVAFGKSWKLFFLTLAANCISFGAGLLIFR
jgi:hypothetical protein